MILREFLIKLGLTVEESSFAKAHLAAHFLEKGIEKLGEVAKEAAEKFVENIKESIEYGNAIKKTGQSVGIATDALQELQYAAKLSDVSAEEMSTALGRLSRVMQSAKEGGEQAAKALKGVEYKEKDGKLKSLDKTLTELAEQFSKMPDGPEKTARAMELFGRSGKQLIPLLNEGAEGIDELRQEARDLGLVMDGEAVEASEQLNDNLERLHMVGQGLWRTLANALMPAINALVKRFLDWRKASGAIITQKIKQYADVAVRAVTALMSAFEGAIMVLDTFKQGLANLWNAAGAFKAVIIGLGAAVALAFSPLTAVAAMLSGLMMIIEDIDVYNRGGRSVFGRFKKQLDEWLKPNAEDPWWLTAVKDLVRLLEKAILLKKEFDEAMGRVSAKEIDRRAGANAGERQAAADRFTLATARARVGKGLALTNDEKAALERGGVTEEAFVQKYSPEYRPGVSGGGMSVSAPVQINVSQQSGEDSEQFAQRVGKIVSDHWDGKMEEASGGTH